MIDKIISALESMQEDMEEHGELQKARGVSSAIWLIEFMKDFADRKTEPQTDKDFKVTYTCSFTDCDNFKNFGFGEKCIECKRKQSEVKHKDEPQTNADQHVQRVEYVGNDEKSRCWTCKHFERMHETPISSDGSYYTYVVCMASECRYEPKDEPQYDAEEVAKDINRRVDMVKKEWNARHIEDEPQKGEMMTEEEFDSMLARVLTGKDKTQTERSE